MPENENEKLYAPADSPKQVAACEFPYAELDVVTNYSFLRGASHPDELVSEAACLGYRAMAVADVNSFAGIVRAYETARKITNFHLIIGVRLSFIDGTPDVLAWAPTRAAYANLCRLLTRGRFGKVQGECHLALADFLEHSDGILAAIDAHPLTPIQTIDTLADALGDRLSLATHIALDGNDRIRLEAMIELADQTGVPLVATNHVHYHHPGRRLLQDVLTCTRHGCTIHDAGYRLFPNAERYLKEPELMHRLFAAHPQAIQRGLDIAAQCTFKLDELRYDYPTEVVPEGTSPSRYLKKLTFEKARERYPNGVPREVCKLIRKELRFICGSKYESYFLTVYDLVRFARSKDILCQGRGSAANSAVCYCLGVTSVDPAHFQLVFERFASAARNEPPDIDIDFEHERREEVIQYVYAKYGRMRAAMTGSLITYRGRSAIRDVGKALGLSEDLLDKLSGKLDWWHKGTISDNHLREENLEATNPLVTQLKALTTQILGFPRHLGQHVGGMVISRDPLCDTVPIADAAMENRSVIEWDKDDLDVLGIFKVDILALGMMTAISKCLKMVNDYLPLPLAGEGRGVGLPSAKSLEPPNQLATTSSPSLALPRKRGREPEDRELDLHTIPNDDRATYDMISNADTVGVFQIESRAQMSMLPRLRPDRFYDLVIEVAIVRPGPIQGKMVHPYLQRREQQRRDPNFKIPYPKPELEGVLRDTLGVPLFQEQAMRLAIVAAGFTPVEADQLRRAMAAWKRSGGLEPFYEKFINGMLKNGYEMDFAEQCFDQLRGFGSYGFPESHAASFAKLVYASAWLKCHHPAAFTAALLNSQPMGFYAPPQLVRDARQHNVDVRPVDVNASDWDCTLEHDAGAAAVRLGFRQVKGMLDTDAHAIMLARRDGPFESIQQFHTRTGLSSPAVKRLAEADAFSSLDQSRRPALWESMALTDHAETLVKRVDPPPEPTPAAIPAMEARDEVIADYAMTGLSLKNHPVAFARDALSKLKIVPAIELKDATRFPHGRYVNVAGLALVRQRPGTASGVVFITIEDETGVANLILWSSVYERNRIAARHATLMHVSGRVQREGQVVHVLVQRVWDRTELLKADVRQTARNFH